MKKLFKWLSLDLFTLTYNGILKSLEKKFQHITKNFQRTKQTYEKIMKEKWVSTKNLQCKG